MLFDLVRTEDDKKYRKNFDRGFYDQRDNKTWTPKAKDSMNAVRAYQKGRETRKKLETRIKISQSLRRYYTECW